MRIGIDGACLANKRGFGRFARKVVEALDLANSSHQFVVFVDRPSIAGVSLPTSFEPIVVATSEAPTQAASSTGRRGLRDILAFTSAASKAKLDLLYFPATYSYFPVRNVRHVVATMHDTLALDFPDLVFPTWQGRLAWRLKENLAAYQSSHIVTVSQASKADLVRWFGLSAERVSVMSEGPDPCFRPTEADSTSDETLKKYGLDPGSRFLLYVGGLSPHKNLPRLIQAFSRINDQDLKLAIIGDFGDVFHTHVPELRNEIREFNLQRRVLLAGFVPDSELVYLYGRALALVQPSLMEGFGLPPVEAMACGTPVLASEAGSLPEVIGSAGLFFDPIDVEEMAMTIREFLDRPIDRAIALEQSKRYSWAKGAVDLLTLFAELEGKG